MSGQNNQSVDRNLVDQPVKNQERPKINLKIAGIILFICLVILSIGILLKKKLLISKQSFEGKQKQLLVSPTPIEPDITPWETLRNEKYGFETKYHLEKPSPSPKIADPVISIHYEPKTNWQTYTDEVAGFSFQYNPTPDQLFYNFRQSLGSYQPGKNVIIMECLTLPNKQETCRDFYRVTIFSNYDGGSRRKWMNRNIHNYPDCQRYYGEVSVAGKNALLATSECSSWGETYLLIPHGSQMIVFQTEGYSRDEATGKITLEKNGLKRLLSTLKFDR